MCVCVFFCDVCRLRISADPRFESRYANRDREDRDSRKLDPSDLRHELRRSGGRYVTLWSSLNGEIIFFLVLH